MGLDIRAYEKVTPAPYATAEEADEHWEDDPPVVWLGEGHDTRRRDDIAVGAYFATGEVVRFRAGSYSGYNRWRSYLAQMLGTTDEAIWADESQPGAFCELIGFTDCDGVVGPKTSSKLAADFDASRATAAAFAETLPADEREWFSRVYEDFAKAFTIAARGGAVRFC